ncbi:hypothetical protein IT575_00800 [bacterium]|nr:hypothetical protein [bacterium]
MPAQRSSCRSTLTGLALFSLVLALLGCSSGGSNNLPSSVDNAGQRISSQRFVMTILPDTYLGGGQASSFDIVEREGNGELLIDVSVRDAHALKAFFFHLEFDPKRYSVGRLDNAWLLGPESECLALFLSDPGAGVVEFGQLLMLPQEPRADGTEKGFSGDGLLCTLHLKTGPAGQSRHPSAAPGSDGARASLSYSASTQTISWQHFSPGDYNQDGNVAVSDLTPIGIHFSKDVPAGDDPDGRDSNSIEDVVDGSNDGRVNVADLTAIGLNFQSRTSAYNVYRGEPSDLPASNRGDNGSGAELVESVGFDQRQGNAGSERVRFERPLAAPDPAKVYWVRPNDAADGSGASGTPSSSISPGAPNQQPQASIAADVAFANDPPLDVTFTCDASDPDGSIELWEVDFEGDGVYELSSAVNPSPVAHTYTERGLFRATLRVTDDRGASDISRQDIDIPDPANQQPIADIQVDFDTGDVPLTVHFDGSGSSDPDGSIVLYEWSQYSNGYTIESADDPLATFTYDTLGTYTAELRVTDDKGGRHQAFIEINVVDLDNLAPIASLSVSADTGERPLTVDLDASASLDTDGNIINYYWDYGGDGQYDEVTEIPASSFVYNMKGSFSPSVYVVDDDGAQSNTASKDVEVTAGWDSYILNTSDTVAETHSMICKDNDATEFPLVAFSLHNGDLRTVLGTANGEFFSGTTLLADDCSRTFDLENVVTFPAVVYNRAGTVGVGGPVYVRALDKLGDNWGAPVQISSAGGGHAANGICLRIIGLQPAVVYSAATNNLYYCQADNITGSTWPQPATIDDQTWGKPSILHAGLTEPPLIIGMYSEPFGFSSFHPARMLAEDPGGDAWNAVDGIALDVGNEACSALLLEDIPALVYRSGGDLVFRRASSAEATFWLDPVLLYSLPNWNVGSIDMVSIDGLPCIAFHDSYNGRLIFIQSDNNLGASWFPPEVVDPRDGAGTGCSLIDFGGQPLIAYGCDADEQLRMALLRSN